MSAVERAAALGVAALATARLTRFFTSDTLGEWLLVGPAKRWAVRDLKAPDDSSDEHKALIEKMKRSALEEENTTDRDGLLDYGAQGPYASKRARLVKGLDCPFCVGFWLGGIVLLVSMLRRVPVIGPVVRFGLGMLALNYAVGHVSSRMDG